MNKKRVAALFTLSLSKNASRGYMPMESFASSIMSHIRCAHEPLKILFTFEKFLNFGTSFRSKLFIFSKNLRSFIFFCLFPRIRDRRLPRDHEVVYFLPFISCCRAFLVSLPFGKILFCFCCFGDCEGVWVGVEISVIFVEETGDDDVVFLVLSFWKGRGQWSNHWGRSNNIFWLWGS